jgi:hypothetical protein
MRFFYIYINLLTISGWELANPKGTIYVKKPECPVLCTGMNGQCWFWGREPPSRLGFFF